MTGRDRICPKTVGTAPGSAVIRRDTALPAEPPGRRTATASFFLAAFCAILALAPAALALEITVPTRSGMTVEVLVEVPRDAPALILLFEGGRGILAPGSTGFAHRAHRHFLQKGIGSALVGAPVDVTGLNGGLSPWSRETPKHIADIDSVIATLRRYYKLPIWVLGVSNGSRSAAAYAMRRSDRIGGVVLVSSSTLPPNGDPIHTLPRLRAVTVPVLAVAHEDDGCQGSPPSGATEIAKAAIASPDAAAIFFSGGLNTGRAPCGNETHHTLYGIEGQVVSAIAEFITAHPASDTQ